ITRVIAEHPANIRSIESLFQRCEEFTVYLELDPADDFTGLRDALAALPVIRHVEEPPPLMAIYGKRVIIIGGGAQVGEDALAAAVGAVARLPRARILVLAGALMGGAITEAVREVKRRGVLVISLNMAGSVPDAADLVVTDPLQAGVMAVMAIADTARFDISRQRQRRY